MLQASIDPIYTEDNFQAFYTDAEEIKTLMLDLLGDVSGRTILEPCAGEGSFIRGLKGNPKKVTAIDIDVKHINLLNSTFPSWLDTVHTDFVDQFVSDEIVKEKFSNENFDATICNPPYGLKFSVDYRKSIKKKFPNIYARESYGLFMHFSISLLKDGGKYVFIMPDTFLTSTNHKPLRRFLIEEAKLTHIIQFKSKRFQTVNFGYGNLCIIAGIKEKLDVKDKILWCDATKLRGGINIDLFKKATSINGEEMISQQDHGWIHPDIKGKIRFSQDTVLLGEIADCKTGIYTGDNNRFCAYDREKPPSRVNGHPISWEEKMYLSMLSDEEKKKGLGGGFTYVPFIRGGHREPFESTRHAINWSKDSVSYYDKDKKARLQNLSYYFKTGLAIPMVTSGRITASLMENAIFDQGVVGVFPKNNDWLYFLLIYFNDDFVSMLKKTISPSANNSANYLKRIPVPLADNKKLEEAKEIIELAKIKGWEQTKEQRKSFMSSFVTS